MFYLIFSLRPNLGQALGPGFSFGVLPLLMGVMVGCLLPAYDILTAIVAVATVLLWTTNYPLLKMLADVGNGLNWGVFFIWGALLAAAVGLTFRAQLQRHFQKQREELQ